MAAGVIIIIAAAALFVVTVYTSSVLVNVAATIPMCRREGDSLNLGQKRRNISRDRFTRLHTLRGVCVLSRQRLGNFITLRGSIGRLD